MTRVALVPGVPALLPEYAGLEDPVAELRAAALRAAAWLGRDVTVHASDQGARVAAYLLGSCVPQDHDGAGVLVVGNGSAKRTEKAPGHLDERAVDFDAALGAALRAGRPEADVALARELWADVAALPVIGDVAAREGLGQAEVDYDGAPYGVQYWVMRWTSGD